MARMIAISDDLASRLETRRDRAGYSSIEAVAEEIIADGLEARGLQEDDALPFSDDELGALLTEADASGREEPWDAAAVRSEVLARQGARKGVA